MGGNLTFLRIGTHNVYQYIATLDNGNVGLQWAEVKYYNFTGLPPPIQKWHCRSRVALVDVGTHFRIYGDVADLDSHKNMLFRENKAAVLAA